MHQLSRPPRRRLRALRRNPQRPATTQPATTKRPRTSTINLLNEAGPVRGDWTVADELVARLTPIAGEQTELLELVEIRARLASHSRAPNTQAAYTQHWRTFQAFCDHYGLSAELPVAPEVVSYFIAYLAAAGRTDDPPANARASRSATATCAKPSPRSGTATPSTACH